MESLFTSGNLAGVGVIIALLAWVFSSHPFWVKVSIAIGIVLLDFIICLAWDAVVNPNYKSITDSPQIIQHIVVSPTIAKPSNTVSEPTFRNPDDMLIYFKAAKWGQALRKFDGKYSVRRLRAKYSSEKITINADQVEEFNENWREGCWQIVNILAHRAKIDDFSTFGVGAKKAYEFLYRGNFQGKPPIIELAELIEELAGYLVIPIETTELNSEVKHLK